MPRRILDFLVEIDDDEEYAFSHFWLKAMLLASLVALLLYGLYSLLVLQQWQTTLFSGILSFILATLYLLLHIGQVRLVSIIFSLTCITSMAYASAVFGGVRSGSYFGLVLVLILTALFLRTQVLAAVTILSIVFGAYLAQAEMSGQYSPDASFLTPWDSWISTTLIFILAALVAGTASQIIRQAFKKERLEVSERHKIELTLREQTQYLTALHETTLSIIRRLELLPLLESIMTHAQQLAETEHGYIDMRLPGSVGVMQMVGHGIFTMLNKSMTMPGQGATGRVLITGEPVIVDDYETWEGRIPQYAVGFRAIVAVPLKVQGDVIGVVGLAHTTPNRQFSHTQIKYLQQFAELAALALDNARLYQASQDELNTRKRTQDALAQANQQLEQDTMTLERRSTLLQVAAEVSRAASAILELDVLSQQVVDLVKKRFDLYYVGLFLVDEANTFAVLQAATGEAGQKMLQSGYRLALGNTSMVGWCITNRRARIALDVGEDTVHFSNPLLSKTRSEIALPLISRGEILGALTIQSDKESALTNEDIETFQAMADQLANAILNARLYDQLEKELEERRRAEEEVRKLNNELEMRVKLRTTALKASEEKFRALAENNPLQITRYSRDGRYLYINRAGNNDLLQPKDLIGKTIREVVTDPAIIDFFEACIRQVFDTGQPYKTEYALEDEYAVWSLAPEFDQQENVISVIATTLDITERKHMEEELHQRSLELQASNRELEAFSYSVSHDLRAPLRALDGYSRIILEDFQENMPDEGRKYLTRIRDASQQMSQLIDDMLRLSRVTRAEMHFLPINITEIATSILDELQARHPDRVVQVKVEKNLITKGDEGLLRMALANLLNNAWKFSGKTNDAKISVGREKINGKEAFYIRDNGVGFDMAYADKLFGTFQRLHRVEEFPGTGIGLAIVQRVINRHGGIIWAESEPGKGATFYFTL